MDEGCPGAAILLSLFQPIETSPNSVPFLSLTDECVPLKFPQSPLIINKKRNYEFEC